MKHRWRILLAAAGAAAVLGVAWWARPVGSAKPQTHAALEISAAWSGAQSDDVQAATLLGFVLGGEATMAARFRALEARTEAGDAAAAQALGTTLARCRNLTSGPGGEMRGANRGIDAARRMCGSLPQRHEAYAEFLIESAEGHWQPIAPGTETEARRQWRERTTRLLGALAEGGDAEAMLELGDAFLARREGSRDVPRARVYYQGFLKHADPGDVRRPQVLRTLEWLCRPASGEIAPDACG